MRRLKGLSMSITGMKEMRAMTMRSKMRFVLVFIVNARSRPTALVPFPQGDGEGEEEEYEGGEEGEEEEEEAGEGVSSLFRVYRLSAQGIHHPSFDRNRT
jgi:hypothetical protein